MKVSVESDGPHLVPLTNSVKTFLLSKFEAVRFLCSVKFFLGKDNFGFGFGGTGKKSYSSQFDDYGEVTH